MATNNTASDQNAESFLRAGLIVKKFEIPALPPDLLDVGLQLDDLRLLKAGWYDGINGKSFRGQDLDWLATTWKRLQPNHVELPHIYPTPSGEVQAEWTFGQREILVRIDINSRRGRWYCMNMNEPSEEYDEEHDLDLEQVEAWKWLFQRISHLQAKLV